MKGNQIEKYRPSYCLSRLIRGCPRVENFRLTVLMIGVAACVPTGFSPMVYSKQTVYRTWVLGALACLWIQTQIQTAMGQVSFNGESIRLLIGAMVRLGATGVVCSSISDPHGPAEEVEGDETGQLHEGKAATTVACQIRYLEPRLEICIHRCNDSSRCSKRKRTCQQDRSRRRGTQWRAVPQAPKRTGSHGG
jgi:hypothetical protein